MPVRLSPRVLVYGVDEARPVSGDGELVLPQRPSEAFGDGRHPTTRLCAGAVDLLCRQRALEGVLDVGTGTGVLARIARGRGAQAVRGTDLDPVALVEARENSALDGEMLPITDTAPDQLGRTFELIVANILEGPLRELAPALERALSPGGRLLVSGFTFAQVPGLQIGFERAGFRLDGVAGLDGWALATFFRRG